MLSRGGVRRATNVRRRESRLICCDGCTHEQPERQAEEKVCARHRPNENKLSYGD
jgi:hypothetical protein